MLPTVLEAKEKQIVASDNFQKNKLSIALLPTLFTFFKPHSCTIFQAQADLTTPISKFFLIYPCYRTIRIGKMLGHQTSLAQKVSLLHCVWMHFLCIFLSFVSSSSKALLGSFFSSISYGCFLSTHENFPSSKE